MSQSIISPRETPTRGHKGEVTKKPAGQYGRALQYPGTHGTNHMSTTNSTHFLNPGASGGGDDDHPYSFFLSDPGCQSRVHLEGSASVFRARCYHTPTTRSSCESCY